MGMASNKTLFIGDSLIQYFDWQGRFPAAEVFNLGIAGETVEGLFRRLEGITGKFPSVDYVFVMTGINNVAMEDLDFLDSYKRIIERLSSAYPAARIVVHSLLPTLLDRVSDRSVREVNGSLKKIARETGAEYLDIHSRFVDSEGYAVKDYLLPDGVHLSDKGYAVWAEIIEKRILG